MDAARSSGYICLKSRFEVYNHNIGRLSRKSDRLLYFLYFLTFVFKFAFFYLNLILSINRGDQLIKSSQFRFITTVVLSTHLGKSYITTYQRRFVLTLSIFRENEGFSSGFFQFFLQFDLIESFWIFHGGFHCFQVPKNRNQCFIMSKPVQYFFRHRSMVFLIFILKTTYSHD